MGSKNSTENVGGGGGGGSGGAILLEAPTIELRGAIGANGGAGGAGQPCMGGSFVEGRPEPGLADRAPALGGDVVEPDCGVAGGNGSDPAGVAADGVTRTAGGSGRGGGGGGGAGRIVILTETPAGELAVGLLPAPASPDEPTVIETLCP